MADTAAVAKVVPLTPTKKVAESSKKSKAQAKASHPPTSDMVNNAIKNLKERGGSSLQAIKKYIAANYKVDVEKLSLFIRKYIKAAVISGVLVQTKGKGASGSFKLATGSKSEKAVAPKSKAKKTSPSAKKSTSTKVAKGSPIAKKAKVAPKKSTATEEKKVASSSTKSRKRASSAVAEKKVAKPKSPSKAKKTSQVPTNKPKVPKPKKLTGGLSKPKARKTAPKKK